MELDQHFVLSIIHLVLVVPLFLFIGFQRSATPSWLYLATLAIGIVIFLYHGVKLLVRLQTSSSYWWVNALHVAIVAPLLIYIGYFKKETPRFAYELLLMLGFAAAGYHLFSLVRMMEVHPEPKQ
jgi:hypothetical protein